MTYQTCSKCGWWQRNKGPCAGCSCSRSARSVAAPASPLAKQKMPKTLASLQQQWDLAKASAHNPKHVKLEHMCIHCFGRSLSAKGTCRSCSASMADAVTIVPGQWPPIGATKTMLSRLESGLLPATPLEPTTAQAEDTPMAEEMESPPMRECPLQGLSAQQLRQEIARLERHILDLAQDGYGPLRDALEDNLAQTRAELLARKPEGQALDQAVAKHKHAQRALQLATQKRDQARESLRLAEAAFQQTKLTEEAAAQEVQKQRSTISDYEALAPPLRPVSSEKLVGLYQILQQARVQDRHLQEVATLSGAPPQPPPRTTEEGRILLHQCASCRQRPARPCVSWRPGISFSST